MRMSMVVVSLLSILGAHSATAAEFAVKDVSGESWCLNALPTAIGGALCSSYLPGSLRITVTPEAGELPVACFGDGRGGKHCSYAARIFFAARHGDGWYAKNTYGWEPVDISRLQATTKWPPWSGTASMTYDLHVGAIDLATSQGVPPPEGLEVFIGLAPEGSMVFKPGLVARIYPVPAQ